MPVYRQAQNFLSYAGAIVLPYLFGARGILWAIIAIPLVVILAGLQAYLLKYLLPPTLGFCPGTSLKLT